MSESNNPLLARAEYLAHSHDRLPSHLRPAPYSSVAEALGEVPPSPEAAEIAERLAAYRQLIEEEIPAPLDLVMEEAPGSLAKAAKRESERYALRSYLLGVGSDVVSSLDHKLRGLRTSAEGYAHQIAHHRGQLDELVTDLYEAAAALGDKLLDATEHAIEHDAAEVGRYSNAVAKLTSVTRIPIRDRHREPNDRVSILFSPVYDAPTPLRVRADVDGEVTLSTPEEVRQHEDSKLLFQLWKRGSGLALGAVALGILPSYSTSVADNWDEVSDRYDKMTRSASRDVEAQAGSSVTVSTKGDTVTPAPNWEY